MANSFQELKAFDSLPVAEYSIGGNSKSNFAERVRIGKFRSVLEPNVKVIDVARMIPQRRVSSPNLGPFERDPGFLACDVVGRRIKYAAGEPRFDALSATFSESLATYRVARKSSGASVCYSFTPVKVSQVPEFIISKFHDATCKKYVSRFRSSSSVASFPTKDRLH